MDDGSAVILSVAKYYTPSGKAIQDAHVTPNVLQAEPRPSWRTMTTRQTGVPPPPSPERRILKHGYDR